jgi:hypothetical protein
MSWTGRGRRNSPGRPLSRTSASLHPHKRTHTFLPCRTRSRSLDQRLVCVSSTVNRKLGPCQSLSTPTSSTHLTALDARPPRHARVPLPARLPRLARLVCLGRADSSQVSEDDGARPGSAQAGDPVQASHHRRPQATKVRTEAEEIRVSHRPSFATATSWSRTKKNEADRSVVYRSPCRLRFPQPFRAPADVCARCKRPHRTSPPLASQRSCFLSHPPL